jgi:hypothetical protein
MSLLSPKPIIARVVREWRVSPGMTFALALDVENRVWVTQSCPAGTQFWTVTQAAHLLCGPRTRPILRELRQLAREFAGAEAQAERRLPLRRSGASVLPEGTRHSRAGKSEVDLAALPEAALTRA